MVPDGTKVLIAMGMLPTSTSPSVKLALKGIRDYTTFTDALRDTARFLEEHGGPGGSGAHAHLIDQPEAERAEERREREMLREPERKKWRMITRKNARDLVNTRARACVCECLPSCGVRLPSFPTTPKDDYYKYIDDEDYTDPKFIFDEYSSSSSDGIDGYIPMSPPPRPMTATYRKRDERWQRQLHEIRTSPLENRPPKPKRYTRMHANYAMEKMHVYEKQLNRCTCECCCGARLNKLNYYITSTVVLVYFFLFHSLPKVVR